MRPFKFSRPKGPGFGITDTYFLTVLSSKSVLPSILVVLNPKGEGGAVAGFGAPLQDAKDRGVLAEPIRRGQYVLASPDKKTVVSLRVLGADEAGFDPEAFLRSGLGKTVTPEMAARMRGTWMMLQLNFETHDPSVWPSINFFLEITRRLGVLCDGVIADPISQRYLMPEDAYHMNPAMPVEAIDLVQPHGRARGDGIHVYTLGMTKLGLPEFELYGVTPGNELDAETFLIALCQEIFGGAKLESGDRVGADSLPFEIRQGGLDRGMWEGLPVLELLPPTQHTSTEAVSAWLAEVRNER